MRVYKQQNVLDAARERIAWIFHSFPRVVVSISSGKDSTVLAHLCSAEALRQGKEVGFFFLDQEAEYAATIDQVRIMMTWSNVRPLWYQVPIRMTNATSYEEDFLFAWGPGLHWMREKEPESVHAELRAPDRFYPFFRWMEGQLGEYAAVLIGLRSEESLNRYRAVIRHPGREGITWSSKGNGTTKFYPLYDWTFEDVWAYLSRYQVPYNKIYDWLYVKGESIPGFRVSNLIHEKAFKCLAFLQEFEPETYNRLIARIGGITVAARYVKETSVFRARMLPKIYKTWKDFRDFLLETIPTDTAQLFRERFDRQLTSESVYRQQVRQLLLNDWENNVPVVQREDTDSLEKWRKIL